MSLAGVALAADRGVGEQAVVETLPDVVVDAAGVLTILGDPLVLLVVVALGYLLADHLGVAADRMATAFALAVGAFGLTLALKHAFTLPRPPGAGVDGYGFPSGHALGATVVYGGLAALVNDRYRYLPTVAAGLIVLVAATRIAVGVHYLVDVLVGVAVGGGYLALALRVGPGVVPDRVVAGDASRTFALAVAVGLVAVGVAAVRDTAVATAAAAGGWLGWRFAARRLDCTTSARGGVRGRIAAVVTIPVVAVAVETVLDGAFSLPVAAGVTLVVVATLLAAPGLSVAVGEKRTVGDR